ncbi:1503_t:CDS:2, partial [Dentiscutata erythropus]
LMEDEVLRGGKLWSTQIDGIRFDVAHLTYQKATILLDQNVYPTRDEQIEFMKKSINEDKDLLQLEKNFLLEMLDLEFD